MSKTTIPTGGITADAIDATLIADDAINSEHYTDGSIDTAHIGDSQVTAAKTSGVAGNTDVDYWYFSNNQTISALTETTVSGHWARQTDYGGAGGELGSGLSQSSGVFSFPSTGIYYVKGWFRLLRDGDSRYNNLALEVTLNNSSYSTLSYGSGFTKQVSGGNTTSQVNVEAIIDVTDTSNVKFRFRFTTRQEQTINGAAYSMTGMTAVRLGAT